MLDPSDYKTREKTVNLIITDDEGNIIDGLKEPLEDYEDDEKLLKEIDNIIHLYFFEQHLNRQGRKLC